MHQVSHLANQLIYSYWIKFSAVLHQFDYVNASRLQNWWSETVNMCKHLDREINAVNATARTAARTCI